jgi:hypothetical protein
MQHVHTTHSRSRLNILGESYATSSKDGIAQTGRNIQKLIGYKHVVSRALVRPQGGDLVARVPADKNGHTKEVVEPEAIVSLPEDGGGNLVKVRFWLPGAARLGVVTPLDKVIAVSVDIASARNIS